MQDLIHQFGIDWKLLIAQLVNFFILFYVLKRFAFGPIMKILKERRENVEKGIKLTHEVEGRIAKIEQEREMVLLQTNNKAIEIINKAEIGGKKKKEEIHKEAIRQAEEILQNAKMVALAEKSKASKEALQEMAGLLKTSLSKVLGKMESSKRDDKLIEEAINELQGLKE